jgi:hypothetical protein
LLVIAIATSRLGVTAMAADKKDDEERRKNLEAELAEFEAKLANDPVIMKAKTSFAVIAERISKAERLEVYRLNSTFIEDEQKAKGSFHGYEILAQAKAESAEQRKEIGSFVGAVLHWNKLRMALCFNPRHGLRVISGKDTLDLVICFECSRVEVYDNGKLGGTFALTRQATNPLDRLLHRSEQKAKD